jgi:hypothetical protein
LLIGSLTGALARWVAFLSKVPAAGDPTSAIRVVEDFTKNPADGNWAITRIGDGSQAEIFIINSTSEPIWRASHSIVVKMYKPDAAVALETVQAQFEALSTLHAALDGSHANGWKISVPRPLYVCKAPLALVMTAVPGAQIETCVAQGNAPAAPVLLEVGRAAATAMQACWSRGRRHGDFGIQNLLFDMESKELSLIDAGTADSCYACNGGGQDNSTAADVAHLLCSVASDMMDLVNSQSARIAKQVVAESALLVVIENADADQKRRLLSEIWDCFQEHLPQWFQPSWSPKGVLHRFAAQVARNRVRSMLSRVNSHRGAGHGMRSEHVSSAPAVQFNQ